MINLHILELFITSLALEWVLDGLNLKEGDILKFTNPFWCCHKTLPILLKIRAQFQPTVIR